MRRRLAAICVMLVGFVAACIQSRSTTCGDLTCPMGTSCGPSGDICVYTDLLDACHNVGEGSDCNVPGVGSATCKGGVCQASRCGDGRVTGTEDCDGDVGSNTCLSLKYYQPDGLACNPTTCKFDTTHCVGKCGDGIKNGQEQCDVGDLGGATCFTAGFYAAPGLACNPATCTFDTTACGGGRCGDGIVNGLELCDGAVFPEVAGNAMDCTSAGFPGATTGLKCSKTCRYTPTSCLCTASTRCNANTQRCECSKTGGCGCVTAK